MSYNLKDVFYLAADMDIENGTYTAANKQGIIPIDVSAYVDPIAKGKRRGQGLAIYRVYQTVTSEHGSAMTETQLGSFGTALTVKPYTVTGHDVSGSPADPIDFTAASDVCIHASTIYGQAQYPGLQPLQVTLEPSDEVPFVAVRDTIFMIFTNSADLSGAGGSDFNYWYRLECSMITLDTATLNQLLRTQTV
jgi:hypothetical protein